MHIHTVGVSLVSLGLLALGGNRALRSETGRPAHIAYATTDTAAVRQELMRLESDSWKAWRARDSAFFNRFLSEDHVEVGPGGVARKQSVVAGVGSPACVVSGYSFGDFAFTMFNEQTALLTYRAEQQTLCGGHPVPSPVWASSLYVLRKGHWINAAYQQTPIPAH